MARVQTGLDKILLEHQCEPIFLLTHGRVIRSVLAKAFEIKTQTVLKLDIAYAQMSRLHCYTDGNFSLLFLGKNANTL